MADVSLRVPLHELRWFTDSPDGGDPRCVCSWCGLPIAEDMPLRLYRERPGATLEARFHTTCFGAVTGLHVQTFDDELDD